MNNEWFNGIDSRWAKEMTVTNKSITAKSGDIKDYLSWAIYHWPDCSNVRNTTELTQEEVWNECRYVSRDGLMNPDAGLIKDKEALQNMSNSIYLSAMAYLHTGDSRYTTHINHALHTFFINNETRMNPNLNYAQAIRGPGDQMGAHTGVLDLACMAKIVSGVQVMRSIKPAEWQQETETGMMQWASEQLDWLYTSKQGLAELSSIKWAILFAYDITCTDQSFSNHGTFAVNQVCALNVLLNQNDACATALEKFYNGIYLYQIDANGDQPLESARTRPYHYRAFNLMALVTNAQFGDFVGLSPSAWERRSAANTTIVDAVHYAMLQNYTTSNESNQRKSLNPVVAVISAKYGDPDNKYANFLKSTDPYFPGQPWFALNEGLSNAGIKQGLLETTYGPVPPQPTLGAVSPDDLKYRKRRDWEPRGIGWPKAAPRAP